MGGSTQTIDLMLTPDALYCLVKDFGERGPHGADLINHSCTPNCEVEARLLVRTARAIAAHEELFVDSPRLPAHHLQRGHSLPVSPACPTVISCLFVAVVATLRLFGDSSQRFIACGLVRFPACFVPIRCTAGRWPTGFVFGRIFGRVCWTG